MTLEQIEMIEKAMEAYRNKYYKEKPWVTVEKNLYSMSEINDRIKKSRQELENTQEFYICIEPSLKTNYLY